MKTSGSKAKRRHRSVWLVLVGVLVVGGALALSGQRETGLTRVPVEHVCMVNNKYFADPQIPVAVGAKTYFGCCEMCKGRLANDPGVRTARDPVSGAVVDKADAVIGMRPDGRVYYFESERTLRQFRPSAGT